jgi:hypothetical protein
MGKGTVDSGEQPPGAYPIYDVPPVGLTGRNRARRAQQHQLQLAPGRHDEQVNNNIPPELRMSDPRPAANSDIPPELRNTASPESSSSDRQMAMARAVSSDRSISSNVVRQVTERLGLGLENHFEQQVDDAIKNRLATIPRAEPVESETVPPEENSTTRTILWIIVFVLVLVLIAIAIAVGVVLSSREKEPTALASSTAPPSGLLSVTTSPTVSPTHSERFIAIRDVLYGVSGDALLDESSSQYQAFQWIVFEDGMQATVSSQLISILVERYIFALLYFATNGPLWKSQYGFLTSSSVCDWNEYSYEEFGILCSDDGNVDRIYLGRYWLMHLCVYKLVFSSGFSFPMTIRRKPSSRLDPSRNRARDGSR